MKIDAENQLVMVMGSVDPVILINKLIKSGKHARLWSPNSNQKHKFEQENASKVYEDRYPSKGLDAHQNEHVLSNFGNKVEYGPNIRNKSMNGKMHREDLIEGTKVEHGHIIWEGDTSPINEKWKDDMISIIGDAKFQYNGADVEFDSLESLNAGVPSYFIPSNMVNNMQQHLRYNHPSMAMMNMQGRHNNNNMVDENSMYPYLGNIMKKTSLTPDIFDQGLNYVQHPYF